MTGSTLNRPLAFGIAVIAAIAAVAAYVFVTRPRPSPQPAPGSADVAFIRMVPTPPFLLFRNGLPGELYGRLAAVPLGGSGHTRLIAPLSCERVHYAAGWGVCMATDETRLPAAYYAYAFDAAFTRGSTIPLTGPPIRARVAPDGRHAALTVFEKGHSYADASFSTRTTVVETATGRVVADLEDFSVAKEGTRFKAIDFNFWGVTFARDGNQFFATLKSGAQRYLLKGAVDTRQAAVIGSDVECPSLSPDETLLVFKKPLTRGIGWQLHVMDLATRQERPLNQVQHSVDDQVDWFDNTHVVYHDSTSEGTGIWVLSVDGVTPPQLLLPNAYSPAVQR